MKLLKKIKDFPKKKILTKEKYNELDNNHRDEYGWLNLSNYDCSEIKEFGNCIRFGDGIKFGDDIKFGNRIRFGYDIMFGNNITIEGKYKLKSYLKFCGFGSRSNTDTYIYNCEEGIFVRCDCFFDSMEEFIERVEDEVLY
jgi:hypothetical protein